MWSLVLLEVIKVLPVPCMALKHYFVVHLIYCVVTVAMRHLFQKQK